MMSYFLPINSMCLAHYFGCACIKPAKYFDNKPKDLQDRYNEYLLLTSNLGTQETDCCVELYLSADEEKDIVKLSDSWFLFKSFLPISRVKRIYFSSKEQKDTTITNITMSTAFVPERMLCKSKKFATEGTSELSIPDGTEALDLTEQITKYDRFLGALALMRVGRETYMNVSENYVDTLSFFNDEIRKQLTSRGKINNKYTGLFSEKGEYFPKLLPYLMKIVEEKDVEKIARNEGQSIKRNHVTKVIDLLELTNGTYIIAFLYTFGVGGESRKKKIDDAIISNFHADGIKAERAEVLALCYGYNRGYSVFNNLYGLSPYDRVDVKFRLEDKLELYAIESVFSYIIGNHQTSGKIEHIDKWIPSKKFGKLHANEYVILDTKIIGKKKPKVLSQEWWTFFFQRLDWGRFESTKTWLESFDLFGIIESLVRNVAELVHTDTVKEVAEECATKIEKMNAELQEVKSENECLHRQVDTLSAECDSSRDTIEKLSSELQKEKSGNKWPIEKVDTISTECNSEKSTKEELQEVEPENNQLYDKNDTISAKCDSAKATECFQQELFQQGGEANRLRSGDAQEESMTKEKEEMPDENFCDCQGKRKKGD